ncbi:hypothetical protein D3C86_1784150 [compost metagenome]
MVSWAGGIGERFPVSCCRIKFIKPGYLSVPVPVLNAANQVDFIIKHECPGGAPPAVFRNCGSFTPFIFNWIEDINVRNRDFMRISARESAQHVDLIFIGNCLEMAHFKRRSGQAAP